MTRRFQDVPPCSSCGGQDRSPPGRQRGRDWRGAGVHTLYDLLIVIAFVVLAPYLMLRLATSRRYRAGLKQRLGLTRLRHPERPCVWVHGVSVGEVRAAQPLVTRLETAHPELEVVISTTTLGGQEVARRLYPGRYIFYFPLDFGPVVRKFVGTLRPRIILLVELEIWPNLLYVASRARIPVVIVNGRITERSWQGYRRLGRFLPQMERIAYFLVQNEDYRRRLIDLGVPGDRVEITGNLKYDALPTDQGQGKYESLRRELGLRPGERVILGGSTHEGEEAVLWRVFTHLGVRRDGVRLLLVPRHLERVGDVMRTLSRAGARTVRVTSLRSGEDSGNADSVLLLDTLGELASFYGVADVVFVGGSLVPHGGQNMMEPAALGKPVLFGPHVQNFRDEVALLLQHEAAIQVASPEELELEMGCLLDDPGRARELGERARSVALSARGATERSFAVIRRFVGEPSATGLVRS
ncbi:MAG: 3-deoxy-D-manno-octulosonic acid transferase [Planctomycetota bacterium]